MRNQTGAFAYFGKEIKVVIDFYHEPAYVLDRFPNSRLLWTKNGVSRIEIISNDGEGIKLWLSMQGDMLKIISPVYLKNWLVENLQKTLSYYQNSLPLEEKRREEKRREEKRREEKRREEKRREEKRREEKRREENYYETKTVPSRTINQYFNFISMSRRYKSTEGNF
ncbi:hypothetical protein [Streptococcus hyovaginalis]|uniref:hypothetical protein n=1 Tax=Streptococcus hyovaginalis TaxID=149015 RepID=UPI003B3A39E9